MEFSVFGEGVKIQLFLVTEEFSWTNSELKGKKMLKTMEATQEDALWSAFITTTAFFKKLIYFIFKI